MDVGWIYSDRFLRHRTDDAHPDQPARLTAIVQTLRQRGLLDRLKPIDFEPADALDLALAHEPAYVELVRMVCAEGFTFIGSPDTLICEESYDTARLATGGVLAACDAVMRGEIRRAFCAVRPPGHHAERDRAMGFCLFNHVAVAAEHLIQRHGLKRVAVIDIDVHHGNGTQSIFDERADVMYLSIHESPAWLPFPGTGEVEEVGSGAGMGYTLNVPLKPGCGEAEYRATLEHRIIPETLRFDPQFVLMSTGFDAMIGESQLIGADMNLPPQAFGWMTRLIADAADKCCEGRLVSVLEGGYQLDKLGVAAAAHVEALLS